SESVGNVLRPARAGHEQEFQEARGRKSAPLRDRGAPAARLPVLWKDRRRAVATAGAFTLRADRAPSEALPRSSCAPPFASGEGCVRQRSAWRRVTGDADTLRC